jgi:hypothetical protein
MDIERGNIEIQHPATLELTLLSIAVFRETVRKPNHFHCLYIRRFHDRLALPEVREVFLEFGGDRRNIVDNFAFQPEEHVCVDLFDHVIVDVVGVLSDQTEPEFVLPTLLHGDTGATENILFT